MKPQRSRPRVKPPAQNLDSFMDVLTNTVGVMIFVCLFASLTAAVAPALVRTPLARESSKSSHFFECREDRVTPLDEDQASEEVQTFFRSLDANSFTSPQALFAQINGFQTRTRYYQVNLDVLTHQGSPIVQTKFTPLSTIDGETSQRLEQPRSQFQQTLNRLDPNRHSLIFFVRPDSFNCFRTARSIGWNQGFDVGWEPWPNERDIIFVSGGGGRRVTVQ
ncbi:hypothetical protein L3556_09550 [Candidatus Synechococcus calcipolaris G9]|uniref:Uncharacterized protein n=1 Tax=Candidatus Synechococcus calcipolaris G9 TaxID=1497997 RepID=A0ABT6F009_9SYNE|nr:hypothetical protein [Candidatus Synechococcus calcipolaris]MDG2991170.1 hypothetical protein [Candidatus Synechococcus calcipolaris G9]